MFNKYEINQVNTGSKGHKEKCLFILFLYLIYISNIKEGEIIHYKKSILYVCNKYNYVFNQIEVYIDNFINRLEAQHAKSHKTPDPPHQQDPRPTAPGDPSMTSW